jgi:hypothetical protein
MWNQLFDGYCPESSLDGEKVRMPIAGLQFIKK